MPAEMPVFRISVEDKNPERIFGYLEMVSLFVEDQQKIAVLDDIGAFPKPFRDAFTTYMEKSGLVEKKDTAVFVTNTLSDKAKKSAKPDTLIATLTKKPIWSERIDTLENSALARWAKERALERGLVLSPEGAATLAASFADSAAIAQEIEKLALYLGASSDSPETVTMQHLAQLSQGRIAQDAFKLIDAMGKKNHGEIFRILLRLFGMGEDPVKILGLLVYGVRAMLVVKDAQSRPIPPADILRITGLGDWQVRHYSSATAKFSLEDLQKLYERLMGVDYKMKTGEGNSHLLLERFLLSV